MRRLPLIYILLLLWIPVLNMQNSKRYGIEADGQPTDWPVKLLFSQNMAKFRNLSRR